MLRPYMIGVVHAVNSALASLLCASYRGTNHAANAGIQATANNA